MIGPLPIFPCCVGRGEKLGVNVAILGKLNIVRRFADNCQMYNINFTIVDLMTGKIYQESGSSWNMDARDSINSVAGKRFKNVPPTYE